MPSFYKESHYNVGELIAVLQNLPKDYSVQVNGDELDFCSGEINEIDINHDKKKVCFWFD